MTITRRSFLASSAAVAAIPMLGAVPSLGRPRVLTAPYQPSQWNLVFSDSFTTDIPLGQFPESAPGWGAYPYPDPDTATNLGLAVGGVYDPHTTTSVSGGQLHVRQWRGSSGPVHCSTPYPLASNNVTFGRFIETTRVSQAVVGYKSAHMLWGGSSPRQDNWPENNWAGFHASPHAFFHYGKVGGPKEQLNFPSNALWTDWHTYEIRWQPGMLTAYLDATVIGQSTDPAIVPTGLFRWRLQNESSVVGAFASPNTQAQIDTSHIEYWSWAG